MLTQERLKKLLYYDPKTGVFRWKVGKDGRKNAVTRGDIAGGQEPSGYVKIGVDGIRYRAHRLAFLYMLGYFPEHGVDHVDRIVNNNAWNNLREASQSCNMRNTGNRLDNTSGIKGVYWCKSDSRWVSRIVMEGKAIYLGGYKCFDDAACARLAAEQCIGWDGCDSTSPAFLHVLKMLQGSVERGVI